MSHTCLYSPACTPQPSSHFGGQYTFPIPVRAGGWVCLEGNHDNNCVNKCDNDYLINQCQFTCTSTNIHSFDIFLYYILILRKLIKVILQSKLEQQFSKQKTRWKLRCKRRWICHITATSISVRIVMKSRTIYAPCQQQNWNKHKQSQFSSLYIHTVKNLKKRNMHIHFATGVWKKSATKFLPLNFVN